MSTPAQSPIRVLVVEDDPHLAAGVMENLRAEGYEVAQVGDGRAALEWLREGSCALIVLDVMLPELDGLAVCRTLRDEGNNTPVLFLTARGDPADRVRGLEAGGDDYLAKPFGVRELTARVKALLRRAPAGSREASVAGEHIELAGIALDEASHVAEADGRPIDLTPREFELLACLMRHGGKVLSRDQLLREAWGWEYLVETKTVDTHVKRLRDKLEAAGVDPALVETVRGYGYRFRAA